MKTQPAISRNYSVDFAYLAVTVTLQVTVTPVTSHLAVIVAAPGATPVTTPIGFTLATLSFDDVQVTLRPTAVAGVKVTLSIETAPFAIVRSVLFIVSFVTPFPGATTVTLHEAVSFVPVTESVMFVVPAFTPVTVPLELTVATDASDDFQTSEAGSIF